MEPQQHGEAVQEAVMGTLAPTPAETPKIVYGIGWAVDLLERGGKAFRKGWNGPGQYIALQVPDAQSMNTLPYVYIRTAQGERVPWLASQTDLLATDWEPFLQ